MPLPTYLQRKHLKPQNLQDIFIFRANYNYLRLIEKYLNYFRFLDTWTSELLQFNIFLKNFCYFSRSLIKTNESKPVEYEYNLQWIKCRSLIMFMI